MWGPERYGVNVNGRPLRPSTTVTIPTGETHHATDNHYRDTTRFGAPHGDHERDARTSRTPAEERRSGDAREGEDGARVAPEACSPPFHDAVPA